MRIVNLGFFPLVEQHISLLRKLPGVGDDSIEMCQARTLLPMISGFRAPTEVLSLAKSAVEMAGELEVGDAVIYTGAPDVCVYLDRLLPTGVRILVPMTSSASRGSFTVTALRDVIREGVEEGTVISAG